MIVKQKTTEVFAYFRCQMLYKLEHPCVTQDLEPAGWIDAPDPQPSLVMDDGSVKLEVAPKGTKHSAMYRDVPPLVHDNLRAALRGLLPSKSSGNSKDRKKSTVDNTGTSDVDPQAMSPTNVPEFEKDRVLNSSAGLDPSPKKDVPVDPASETVLDTTETVEASLDEHQNDIPVVDHEQGAIGVLDPTNDASTVAPPSESVLDTTETVEASLDHEHQKVTPVIDHEQEVLDPTNDASTVAPPSESHGQHATESIEPNKPVHVPPPITHAPTSWCGCSPSRQASQRSFSIFSGH